MTKPLQNHYPSFFDRYISLVGEEDLFYLLTKNTQDVVDYFETISIDRETKTYQSGKWTFREVLQHIIDTERVLLYRAFVCLRGDNKMELQSFDDDAYAANALGNKRALKDLLEEFIINRKSAAILLKNAEENQLNFIGNLGGKSLTANAMFYTIVGHAMHHLGVLKTRYVGL